MATRGNPTSQSRLISSGNNNDSNKLRNLVNFVEFIYKATLVLTCVMFVLWLVSLPFMVIMYLDVHRALVMCHIRS